MRYSIGLDEAGRGTLAGSVFVGATAFPTCRKNMVKSTFFFVRDSKKMTARARDEAFLRLNKIAKDQNIWFTVARTTASRIDSHNVSYAANNAAWRAITKIIVCITSQDHDASFDIILDGGLFIKSKQYQKTLHTAIASVSSARTIVRADDNFFEVSLASVVAKVKRDEYMVRVAKQYPEYCFEKHKGYGTLLHIKAIKRFGPCFFHRLTFLRKYRTI
ncbi:MAG: ribonuclease HII [bacterium]